MLKSIAALGIQWGDEGKGKIVDCLSAKFNTSIRYNGGNNAGHTIVIEDKKYITSCVPSSMLYKDNFGIITNGTLLNPWTLIEELARLNIDEDRLLISDNINLVIPEIHCESDKKTTIGSTLRGIGPCYADKSNRVNIRICDLKNDHLLKNQISKICQFHGKDENFAEDIFKKLTSIREKVLCFATPESKIHEHISKNNIILEGSQGALLDINSGTYPFVTSSSIIPPMNLIHKNHINLGICKSYATRVGLGPMISSMDDEIEQKIADTGHEYGSITGRRRKCGWIDLLQMKHVCKILKIDSIAIIKMDVINKANEIKACIGYEGGYVEPYDPIYSIKKPLYKIFEPWSDDIINATSWNEIETNARNFIDFVEDYLEIEVSIISNGSARDKMIINQNSKFYNHINI